MDGVGVVGGADDVGHSSWAMTFSPAVLSEVISSRMEQVVLGLTVTSGSWAKAEGDVTVVEAAEVAPAAIVMGNVDSRKWLGSMFDFALRLMLGSCAAAATTAWGKHDVLPAAEFTRVVAVTTGATVVETADVSPAATVIGKVDSRKWPGSMSDFELRLMLGSCAAAAAVAWGKQDVLLAAEVTGVVPVSTGATVVHTAGVALAATVRGNVDSRKWPGSMFDLESRLMLGSCAAATACGKQGVSDAEEVTGVVAVTAWARWLPVSKKCMSWCLADGTGSKLVEVGSLMNFGKLAV